MSELEPVIGLEIHVQLGTQTKMFCGCRLEFGAPPNTLTCPVCLGLPGALPVANKQAVEYGVKIGLALESEIAERSIFHRKNYFYPDLPKGYQISQFDIPLCSGGQLGDVQITRVHLEDDAAKLNHVGASGRIHGSDASVVDYNRGGTPLAEIVTEPDLRGGDQVREWLQLLRETLRQLEVSDVNMEEGSLRCDANVSLRPVGSTELGTKTELKNMNSFRFVERGIAAEIARQTEIINSGGKVEQETLHFDPQSGSLTSMRSKEQAHDYRYFPEPDMPPIHVSSEQVDELRASLPELPAARAERYVQEGNLPPELAKTLAHRLDLAEFYEQAIAASTGSAERPRQVANWLTGEATAKLGDRAVADSELTPASLAALLDLLDANRINNGAAKQVLETLIESGGEPEQIVSDQGLEAIGSGDELQSFVEAALAANDAAVEQMKSGNERAIGPIIGYVMRETQGRADGGEVTRIVRQKLGL